MLAVKLGDLETVKERIVVNNDLVNIVYKGATLLGLAISRADQDMVQLLCDLGANVNTSWQDQGKIKGLTSWG